MYIYMHYARLLYLFIYTLYIVTMNYDVGNIIPIV